MKNTIFKYFTAKTATDNTGTSDHLSSSGGKTQFITDSSQTSHSETKLPIILISSDEDNSTVEVVKKRKSLKIRKRSNTLDRRKNGAQPSPKKSRSLDATSSLFSNDVNNEPHVEHHEKSNSSIETSRSAEEPYYLRNFKLAIDTVLNDYNDSRLFQGEDADCIERFLKLPISCQKLYIRLFNRKQAWLPTSKVNYKEMGDQMSSILDSLVQTKFVECSIVNGKTSLNLSQILALLSAPALKNLAKSFHISVLGSKEKLSTAILEMSANQRTVFGSTSNGLKNTVLKRASAALGPCYRLEISPKKTFNRVLLVFDVTRGTEDDSEYSLNGTGTSSNQPPYFGKSRFSSQLSTILLAEMGQMVYPTYEVKKCTSVFATREELLEYETAYSLCNQVYAASENAEWEAALRLCEAADEASRSIAESSKTRSISLPHFLRGFSASAVYIRIKSLQVEILQKLRDYKKASDVLHSLLKEKHFCLSRRGYWSERLTLNLDQHLRDHHGALRVVQDSLKDSKIRVGHVIALVERAQKLQSSGKVENFDFDSILKDYNFSKAKEVTIVGRLLPKRMQTGQARFMKLIDGKEDNVILCSVEELALDHYKSEGYDQGIHGEGGTFTCFFCLLMWDIIFMDGVDDVFRTSYQTHPLDYNTDEFYNNRQKKIDARIKQIKEWKSDDFCGIETIEKHWNTYQGVSCTSMNWERFASLQQALSLAECIGGAVLGGIVEVMAKDPRHTRSGLPDLVVWSTSLKSYKLAEVKGPGDRLSNNQKMWMHRLVEMGANVEVCHVTASASRKLGA